MGYFDDPKHKAQGEKEHSALREEKARMKAGMPPVSEQAERTADRNLERTAPENDFVSEEELNKTAEEMEAAPEMETPDEPVRSEKAESVREESEAAREEKAVEKAEEKAPAKQPDKRVRPEGIYREKISFQELLRMENMDTPVRLTQKPHEKERQKEVSHEL